jgi:hypothetical protein
VRPLRFTPNLSPVFLANVVVDLNGEAPTLAPFTAIESVFASGLYDELLAGVGIGVPRAAAGAACIGLYARALEPRIHLVADHYGTPLVVYRDPRRWGCSLCGRIPFGGRSEGNQRRFELLADPADRCPRSRVAACGVSTRMQRS